LTIAAARLASAAADAIGSSDAALAGKTPSIEDRLASLVQEADRALSEKLR
jgi:hypothetical protein